MPVPVIFQSKFLKCLHLVLHVQLPAAQRTTGDVRTYVTRAVRRERLFARAQALGQGCQPTGSRAWVGTKYVITALLYNTEKKK